MDIQNHARIRCIKKFPEIIIFQHVFCSVIDNQLMATRNLMIDSITNLKGLQR